MMISILAKTLTAARALRLLFLFLFQKQEKGAAGSQKRAAEPRAVFRVTLSGQSWMLTRVVVVCR